MDGGTARDQFPGDLLDWADEHGRTFPWSNPDLTAFQMLIAELLLVRTRAENVAPVFEEVIERYPTPEALAAANPEELADLLQPLGLQNKRSQSLRAVAREVHERGGVPIDPDELRELPSLGRYTANATLCFAYQERLPIVDVNVARIYARLFKDLPPADEAHPDDSEVWATIWERAATLLDEERPRDYNRALLDFGAKVCTAPTPACEECFATEYCHYYQTEQDQS